MRIKQTKNFYAIASDDDGVVLCENRSGAARTLKQWNAAGANGCEGPYGPFAVKLADFTGANLAGRLRALVTLAETIARMATESEIEDGMPSEDAISTMNDLIASARKATGINPGYPQVYEVCHG